MAKIKRFINYKNKELFSCDKKADDSFWDKKWDLAGNAREKILKSNNKFLVSVTKQYLTPDEGPILEGGCGKAMTVASLVNNGFKCTGVDFAQKTVSIINKRVSELDVRFGDVRNLEFNDDSYAGYWSLGVIEHFWNGYDDIMHEMQRVVKSGGYIFVSFPFLNLFRKFKKRIGVYKIYKNTSEPENFYQYFLNHDNVINKFQKHNLKHINTVKKAGILGLLEEIEYKNKLLNSLYSYKGKNIFIRILRKFIDYILSFLTPHSVLLIFKNEK